MSFIEEDCEGSFDWNPNSEFNLEQSVDQGMSLLAEMPIESDLSQDPAQDTKVQKGKVAITPSDQQSSGIQFLGSSDQMYTGAEGAPQKKEQFYVKLEWPIDVQQLERRIVVMQSQLIAGQAKDAAKPSSSKRDNNTILKPIFTKFKKIIRRHKHFRQFFDYRLYKENKVSLVDFEKLFSFAEIKGLLEELKALLNIEYIGLMVPKPNYSETRKVAYQEYIDRIFSALNYANSFADRMTILYANRKHLVQLEQIIEFRSEMLGVACELKELNELKVQ